MKDQEKDKIYITRFFDLDLSRDELITFERRITEDLEFKQKVDAYEEAESFINKKYLTNEELVRSNKWKNLSNKHMGSENSKNISWKWIGSIAAGFILLFSIWQINTSLQEPDMNQLIADSWNKKVGLDFNAIRGTTKDSLKQQILNAFNAYEKKEYQSTIGLLRNYKTAALYYEDVLLLRGLSYYKKGKIDIALKTLDTLSLYPTGKKSKVARWYQGLMYLEQGDTASAKHLLILPSNANHTIKLKE